MRHDVVSRHYSACNVCVAVEPQGIEIAGGDIGAIELDRSCPSQPLRSAPSWRVPRWNGSSGIRPLAANSPLQAFSRAVAHEGRRLCASLVRRESKRPPHCLPWLKASGRCLSVGRTDIMQGPLFYPRVLEKRVSASQLLCDSLGWEQHNIAFEWQPRATEPSNPTCPGLEGCGQRGKVGHAGISQDPRMFAGRVTSV